MKKKIIKITITLILLLISSLCILKINGCLNKVENEMGKITINLIKNDEIDKKEVEVNKGETLKVIIERNYETKIESGMLTKIDFISTPNTNEYFILIKINEQSANLGVNGLKIGNHIKFDDNVYFTYTNTKEYLDGFKS